MKRSMNHRKSYAIAKHHAWAGSVLLTLLLAIRLFFEISNNQIDNKIFLIFGFILVFYILISLILTYKHRKGLIEQKETNYSSSRNNNERNLIKDYYKINKKNVKAKQKIIKKQGKELKK